MNKLKRKSQLVICENCNKEFEKSLSEINRKSNLNKSHFCSTYCSLTSKKCREVLKTKESHFKNNKYIYKSDEYNGFRYYFRNCKKRVKDFNLTLQDLKEQWDKQNGICLYTNFELLLFNPKIKHLYHLRASLDRIDSSKGYIKDNIEFISLLINYMKNDISKEETKDLLIKICSNFH